MANILVLDDVMEIAQLIRAILEKQGHAITIFTEEEEALSYAQANAVDLAILDIKLKKMSGIEVLAELKKINPAVKVIMLTGYPTMESARECLRLGAAEYCVKPFDKFELEEKVSRALGAERAT